MSLNKPSKFNSYSHDQSESHGFITFEVIIAEPCIGKLVSVCTHCSKSYKEEDIIIDKLNNFAFNFEGGKYICYDMNSTGCCGKDIAHLRRNS